MAKKRISPKEQLGLRIRVKAAKVQIKSKGDFFDSTYGKMTFKDNLRIDNFWRTNIVSEEFATAIENYVENKLKDEL